MHKIAAVFICLLSILAFGLSIAFADTSVRGTMTTDTNWSAVNSTNLVT